MLSYAEDGRNPAEAQERRVLSAHKTRRLTMSSSEFGNILQSQVDHGASASAMVDWWRSRRADSLLSCPAYRYAHAAFMTFQRLPPK